MPPESGWVRILIDAAKARDIEFSDAEIQTFCKESEKSPLAHWVVNNLALGDLLTKEEVQLRNHLKEDGITVERGQGIKPLGISFDEAGIRQKTAGLKASSRIFDQQTRALKKQKALSKRFEEANVAAKLRHEARHKQYNETFSAEIQHLKFLNDEETSNLASVVDAELEEVEQATKGVGLMLVEILNTHDQYLEGLGHAKSHSLTSEFDITDEETRIQKLVDNLRIIRIEALKDHLDRVYLENLPSADSLSDQSSSDPEEIASLKNDVRSLYTEIEDVMTMLISYEHTDSLSSQMQRIQYTQLEATSEMANQIRLILSKLTVELDRVADKMAYLQSHRIVLWKLFQYLDHISATDMAYDSQEATHLQPEQIEDNRARLTVLKHFGFTDNVDEITRHGSSEVSQSSRILQFNKKLTRDLNNWQESILATRLQRKNAVRLLSICSDETSHTEGMIDKLDGDIAKARTDLDGAAG